jgi:hypothetical protein
MPKLTTHRHSAKTSAPHRQELREKQIREAILKANAEAVHREGEEKLEKTRNGR